LWGGECALVAALVEILSRCMGPNAVPMESGATAIRPTVDQQILKELALEDFQIHLLEHRERERVGRRGRGISIPLNIESTPWRLGRMAE